jgi:nucleoside-diphosphate-sugar epimerase
LVQHGHEVRVIGRSGGVVFEGAGERVDYRQCDITDSDAVREQVRGMEGVVHLAAIPHPAMGSGHEIFRVNCTGTFNVYEAAAQEGIERIVSASSIQALGYTCGVKAFDLSYFPIDEKHPPFTTDPYAFSKQIIEEVGAYYWRREGISGVCLRLPAVFGGHYHRHHEHDEHRERVRRFRVWVTKAYDGLLALPENERQERARRIAARFEALRAERAYERPHRWRGEDWMHDEDLPIIDHLGTLWALVDGRDSAQAIERALLADYEGAHVLYVASPYNCVGIESEVLAGLFFPGVQERKQPLTGAASFVSSDRACDLIGFDPEHSTAWVLRLEPGDENERE